MSIPAERLREGHQILVRGKISFSRLAALIEGEALARSIEQARKRGSLYPTDVPHTTVNLVDAVVLYADAQNPSLEEQFVAEKVYAVKTGENAGKQGYGIDNKSTFLPTILEMDPENAGQYRQLVLERDLASGIDVTLVLQTFKSKKGYAKGGVGLQQVVLNEPVRYYASAGLDTSALAARGIVVNGPIKSVAAAEAPVNSAAAAAAFASEAERAGFDVPANTGADANGYPVPTPGALGTAPVVAQQQFPLSAPVAPVAAQAPAAAPVAAPAPAAAPALSQDAQIAQLQQQLAEAQAAAAGTGGASAFDAVPVATPAGQASPWDVQGGAPATYQG
ncbi:hypothetical protein ACFVU2_19665 [Leifsonia sp. NPDC058194]|uniref:hypothetical protein n=1 Tax=Leifsonia sp. NPDC058194 TaxID=3346374 RepID=UPI0036D963B1